MFAFSVLDKASKTLFFARDRYGIKPLYYGQFNQTFLFASEIKAIEQHPDYQFEINKTGLKEYFCFQNFLSQDTLNAGVAMFPAGHTATLKLDGHQGLTLTRYWDYNFQEPSEAMTREDCREELDRLFQQAVERQLVSDVEVGSYLSGGMDSGSITAISASKIQNMHTFTCGFDMSSASATEQGFDERSKARAFSEYFGTRHHEKIITHVDMENSIDKIAWHLEEPRVGQSYPNYYAAELARSNVKVVLSGAGGDELFAGYPWRYYRAVGSNGKPEYLDKYYNYWQRLVTESKQKSFFAPIWADVSEFSTREVFENVYSRSLDQATTPADFLNQSLYFEAKTFMHGLLVLEDKLSMAHSLESRVPILDNDLVDFAMKIPA
jgi:asparagine synthase (glutamine-hydrolysing)